MSISPFAEERLNNCSRLLVETGFRCIRSGLLRSCLHYHPPEEGFEFGELDIFPREAGSACLADEKGRGVCRGMCAKFDIHGRQLVLQNHAICGTNCFKFMGVRSFI